MTPQKYHVKMRLRFLCDQKRSALQGDLQVQIYDKGAAFSEPKYTFRGFEALPEDMNHLEDKFYGFVFQDSDFSKWIEAVGYTLTNHPDKELLLIPYYAWANRGENEMRVWLNVHES